MPLFGTLILIFLHNFGFFEDPTQIFMLIICYACPTAINLVVLANIYSDNTSDISMILLVGYLVAIITMPITMITIFSLYINSEYV